MHSSMKAIVFDAFGPPENLVIRQLPIPEPNHDEVRIRVRAFGLNSAEAHMRAGEWGKVAPVTGIECVGEVDLDPTGALPTGQSVAAVCGGTTRDERKAPLLEKLGSDEVLIDCGKDLSNEVRRRNPAGVEAVLEIVGVRTLRDSLRMPRRGGSVCFVGFLGGMRPIDAFDPIVDMPSGVNLNFFASAFVLGTEAYPLTDIPMREIVAKAAAGMYRAKPACVFSFEAICEAHHRLESGDAGGKMVVVL